MELATRLARYLIASAARYGNKRKIHLSVLSENRTAPPPFPYEWQRKNVFGCSWRTDDCDAALVWAETALRAGFTVFYGDMKSPGGMGFGCNLASGLAPDDEEEAERWWGCR